MKKTLGLGRGLDALIDTTHVATAGSSSINEIALIFRLYKKIIHTI